ASLRHRWACLKTCLVEVLLCDTLWFSACHSHGNRLHDTLERFPPRRAHRAVEAVRRLSSRVITCGPRVVSMTCYAEAPRQTGVPREVLRWLQSLDLSFSPKHFRRDITNGYITAEIFYWYFPEDIKLHSYDNGTSLATKLSNWSQLEKVRRCKYVSQLMLVV
ncbi:hypothetical protein FKM82_023183, partial [Ascaphus truei]